MTNKIEQLKHWLQDEQANAKSRIKDYRELKETEGALMVQGEVVAFALVIEKVNEIFEDERNSVDEGEKVCPHCDEGYIQGVNGVQKCKECNNG